MEEGRKTLDMGYYVVSMQIFHKVVCLQPNNYEAWYRQALSKYHLDDFSGAEADCSSAISLNPYIAAHFELRGMARIKEEKYDNAAIDFTHAIDLDANNRSYWFNRALSLYRAGQKRLAEDQLIYILKRWPGFSEAVRLKHEISSQ